MERRVLTNEYNNELYEMPIIPRNNEPITAGQASCSESLQMLGNRKYTFVASHRIMSNFLKTWSYTNLGKIEHKEVNSKRGANNQGKRLFGFQELRYEEGIFENQFL